MINIMRSGLGNKPLTSILKNPKLLSYTINEMVRLEKIKKEDELMQDPKKKIFGMLLKAKR
jgi:hypothetical protein